MPRLPAVIPRWTYPSDNVPAAENGAPDESLFTRCQQAKWAYNRAVFEIKRRFQMKTMLPLLSSMLLALASTQLVRADAIRDGGQYTTTIYDVGQYQIVGNTIAAKAQVLDTNGGNGGPILTFVTGSLQSGTVGNGVFAAGGY